MTLTPNRSRAACLAASFAACWVGLLVLLAPAAASAANVLDPKCIEVPAPLWFPHDFVDPGHYCLIDDVEVNMNGGVVFRVLSPGVTFDLGGFEIRNVAADPGNSVGVSLTGERSEVTNGALVGFDRGLMAGCLPGESGQRVTRLHIDGSATEGARLSCPSTLFEGNFVTATGAGQDWASAVTLLGDHSRVVDNDIIDVTGKYGTGIGILGDHVLVTGNRVSKVWYAVADHNNPDTTLCRDNLAADFVGGYGCIDLGNND